MIRRLIAYTILAVLTVACKPRPTDVMAVDRLPPLYPDYADVTVPVNIAPLNFLLRGDYDAMVVTATHGQTTIEADCSGAEATFDISDWHNLLEEAAGADVTVTVTARTADGKWLGYQPFDIHVSADRIDPYMTYRLIEPDYEIFDQLQIMERNVENYDERSLCDYNMVGNRCMNCHTYGANRPDRSFMYVRGEGGGMILNRDGSLRKLNVKTADMPSGSVYGQFSPSGRYIVFSSNVIIPAFHSDPSKRLEVYDTKSDVYVADLDNNTILRSPLLSDTLHLETFPCFSPDGRSIYYCTAEGPANASKIDSLQYHLCRIDFDEATGAIGTRVDTLVKAEPGMKSSVCHPRVSPDGRYMLYTVADCGTFPIWHPEADQAMLDLTTGQPIDMSAANSGLSDTYHSWSSTGRWIVFASKRDDGMYGKPYLCHVAADGTVAKPFALPQRYPSHYDNTLKSYNAPELGTGPVTFDIADVAAAMELPAENFR